MSDNDFSGSPARDLVGQRAGQAPALGGLDLVLRTDGANESAATAATILTRPTVVPSRSTGSRKNAIYPETARLTFVAPKNPKRVGICLPTRAAAPTRRRRRGGLLEKSRDIGWTWVAAGYALQKWLFELAQIRQSAFASIAAARGIRPGGSA